MLSLKTELLARLSNNEQSFPENLAYGMKIWKSCSFYYMSKYEVIFDFFVKGVQKYYTSLAKLNDERFDAEWLVVNEFLALECPLNALPKKAVKELNSVFKQLSISAAKRKALLESFLTILFDVKYRSFYKFDYKMYEEVLITTLEYYCPCAQESFDNEYHETVIERLLSDVKMYTTAATNDGRWVDTFTCLLVSLSEVILSLKGRGVDRQDSLLELLKMVYFKDGDAAKYNKVTNNKQRGLLMGHFHDTPLHVTGLLIEGYLYAYRVEKMEVLLLLKYILLYVFVEPKKSLLENYQQIFAVTKYVFHLLKKYFIKIEQQLVRDFDFTSIFTIKLNNFLEQCSEGSTNGVALSDLFDLICTINDYNPMILEKSIVDIIIKTMFLRKDPETMEKYQLMIISAIEMHIKLNRSENFQEDFFNKLLEYLADHAQQIDATIKGLRKGVIKRKSNSLEPMTIAKQQKLLNGNSHDADDHQLVQFDNRYLAYLYTGRETDEQPKQPERLHLQNFWPTLAFAWPDSNGKLSNAMMNYTKGLLTKRSLTYWKTVMDLLTESLDEMMEDGVTEDLLLKLELSACWMCYFFAGNTLVENSHLYWKKLERFFENTDELMGTFGRTLLNDTEQVYGRLYDPFLKLVYFYGNYRLMVNYYRPDSIESSPGAVIHDYLTESEWDQMDQKVSASDRMLLDRIKLQNIRQLQLVAGPEADIALERITEVVQKITEEISFKQLRWVLLDRSSNGWFLTLLNHEQQVAVAKIFLNRTKCPFDVVKHLLRQISTDHALVEIFALATYERIVEKVLAGCDNSVAKKFNFADVFSLHEEETLSQVRKLLKQRADIKSDPVELTNPDELMHLLTVLDEIRIDEVAEEPKSILVAINMLLFADIQSCGVKELVEKHENQLMKSISFGNMPNIMKFVTVETLITLFGHSSLLPKLFNRIAANLTPEAFDGFQSVTDDVNAIADGDRDKMMLMIFNNLLKNTANRRKLVPPEQLKEFLDRYVATIDAVVLENAPKEMRKSNAASFSNLLQHCALIVHYKATNKQPLGEEFRERLSQFIEQALKTSSESSGSLFLNCLLHNDYLKLQTAQVDAIVENCWHEFLKHAMSVKPGDNEQPFKVLISFLTREQSVTKFTEKLRDLSLVVEAVRENPDTLRWCLQIYASLAENAFTENTSNAITEAFVKSLDTVISREIIPLSVSKKFLQTPDVLREILNCFAVVVSNPKLKLPTSTMDSMLEFMSSVNISKYPVKEGAEQNFYDLHKLLSNVMYFLMTTRSSYVLHRLPHYFFVFNGLVMSIILYKDDETVGKTLNSFEVLTISDLLLPLKKIMHLAAKKLRKDLCVMAPSILMKIINGTVQSKRSTILHEMIARGVYDICFTLISVYDKHAPAYILRTVDEASRQVYHDIVNRYKKNRKFKGNI